MVKYYSLHTDGDKYLSPHFRVKEFRCKDGSDKILIEQGLITALEDIYKSLKCSSITITSGYRTPAHDKKVGGKGKGNHCEGKAADFICYRNGKPIPSKEVVLVCEDLGILGIGYRCGGNANATHIDVNYRQTKWYGDEAKSMTASCCKSFYTYLGVTKELNRVFTCTASSLRIRKFPNTNSDIIGHIGRGEKIKVISISNDWAKLENGYCAALYLKEM